MKKASGVLTAIIVIALALILFYNSSGRDEATVVPVSSIADTSPPPAETEDTESTTDEVLEVTRDDFNQLPQQEQDEMLDEYILDFWAKELGLMEPNVEEKNLSLEIFNRPYMFTLTEKEFFELSKEDQEKALAEITENCRLVRSYVMDVVAEAKSCMDKQDYKNAEAYYVHCLQTGRELSVDKDGLIITRLVGIACEKAGLNGLVRLYEKTGENYNLQLAREQLSEIDREVEEIKRTAKENEAQS